MGKTAKDVMTKAISYIGTKESPANSNNVIFNTHYYGHAVSGSAYLWCLAYVWDVFRLADASDLFYDGKKTAYCPTLESWGKANKLTVDKSKGKYGDIVLFDFTGKGISGHVGMIVEKNPDGTYKTVEGNTAVGNDANGGCVMYRTRSQSTIRCIIRPKYDTSSTSSTSVSSSTNTSSKTQPLTCVSNVKAIQTYLNKYYGTQIKEVIGKQLVTDNVYGANTKKALAIAFQIELNKNGAKLIVDGDFGSSSATAFNTYSGSLKKGCLL